MRTLMHSVGWTIACLAVGLAALPSLADDSKPKAEAKPAVSASPNVSVVPGAETFLIVPLRVHLLKSDTLDEVDCALTDDDVRRIVGKVNQVWSQAGIHFGLESIRREPAADQAKFKLARDLEKAAPLGLFRALIPKDSLTFDGQHVYYIHRFSVNGVYLGKNTSFVQETAKLRPVPGGIDEPLPRVTAHELGHALSLPHRQDRTNLLASGTTGTLLNQSEVDQVRAAARKLTGTLSMPDARASVKPDDQAGEEQRARRKRWIAEIEALAKTK